MQVEKERECQRHRVREGGVYGTEGQEAQGGAETGREAPRSRW